MGEPKSIGLFWRSLSGNFIPAIANQRSAKSADHWLLWRAPLGRFKEIFFYPIRVNSSNS
jgi:hypothetical protein